MIIFPIVAAGVSGVFAVALFRQYASKRRLAQLAWGIALAQYAIASLAVAAGVGSGWDSATYRIFWLFGALLNVPTLALGSVALVSGRLVRIAGVGVLVLLTVYGLAGTVLGDVDRAALAAETGIPRGVDIWGRGDVMITLARWYSIVAWLVVVGIAAWSSRARKGSRPPADRVRGNWLIAAGASVVAIGGFALSRVGRGSAFSITLALGVLIMFAGFLLASRAPRYRVTDPGDSPT